MKRKALARLRIEEREKGNTVHRNTAISFYVFVEEGFESA